MPRSVAWPAFSAVVNQTKAVNSRNIPFVMADACLVAGGIQAARLCEPADLRDQLPGCLGRAGVPRASLVLL